jgi:hypothetical protein
MRLEAVRSSSSFPEELFDAQRIPTLALDTLGLP